MRVTPIEKFSCSDVDACTEAEGVVVKQQLPLSRREFLQGSGMLISTLLAMGRVLYPRERLPDTVYALRVKDLDAAIQWLDENRLAFVKRPEQGKMKDVAFIKEPDGYWIEIIEAKRLKNLSR